MKCGHKATKRVREKIGKNCGGVNCSRKVEKKDIRVAKKRK